MANTDFLDKKFFGDSVLNNFHLMPFRFDRWSDGRVFLSNDTGEYALLSEIEFQSIMGRNLDGQENLYKSLKSKFFIVGQGASANLDLMASKYRTKKSFIEEFSKLHIFVTSIRCNLSCPYCQVSRKNIDVSCTAYDMSKEVLDASIKVMLETPSKYVTMEFQGGEPLSDFELVKYGVLKAKELNKKYNKKISFVICTNLTLLEDSSLEFLRDHEVMISTSLDGPELLHNANRPSIDKKPTYETVIDNIKKCQSYLGRDSVSALMTTTRKSLACPEDIVDEFIGLGLGSMFIRELNPYGYAVKSKKAIGYTTEEFFIFFKKALDHIISKNLDGECFSEAYVSMILNKLLTPWPVGFVDLQSPTGAGFGVTVYNYDGNVYPSDEARMLAESDDYTFCMGNVLTDSYEDIFFGDTMQLLANSACNESIPGCSDCAYQTYCGADPVRNYATQNDMLGNRAENNSFCKKNKSIIKYVIDLYESADDDVKRILWSWINRSDHNSMRLKEVL